MRTKSDSLSLPALGRREVLGAAIGLAASSRIVRAQSGGPVLVYVGTYTARSRGIYVYEMNSSTGELTLRNTFAGEGNPSFVALHPNGRYLYSVSEVGTYMGSPTGSITAWAINQPSGDLSRLNTESSLGRAPAHISVDPTGRFVMAANYTEGTVTVLPILADGRLGAATDSQKHVGTLGPNTARQDAPHAHMILPDRNGRFAIVNDLSLDDTYVYDLNPNNGTLVKLATVKAIPGAGPRHLAYHPNGRFVFVINELDNSLRSHSWDAATGTLTPVDVKSTLPANYKGRTTTAQVIVSADGRFVYGSNRGHNTIALFSVNQSTGQLTFVETVWTQGQTPRNFNIDPSGRFMYIGHQDSDNITVFNVNPTDGKLTFTGQFIEVPQAVCIEFLRPADVSPATNGSFFRATPNPAWGVNGGAAQVTLSWNAPGTTSVEIHIGSPNGANMGPQLPAGAVTTGQWVSDGMTFYLQDVSGGKPLTAENTLGTVRVNVR